MSLRILIFVECDRCHTLFDRRFLEAKALHSDLAGEVHELVIAAEDEEWGCRRNATQHHCARCLEPF